MFKKQLIFSLMLLPILVHAKSPSCAAIGLFMESTLFDALSNELNIDTSTIDETKAKVELIDASPVSKIYAESLAKIDYAKDQSKDKTLAIYKKIYLSSYFENDVKTITAKYTYINKDAKKDVFIASSLMNKDECSIIFNGYIILSRQF
ncbi:Shiga toxin A subunit [Enterobacter hormaechei]|uniref:Shiga toxin A subunit n=1 Tax=Enterobacter quasihormaechei TaxID=2529382 RepID=UPI0015EB527E